MKQIDTGLFLNDFEAEARTHIEKIENAFLDVDALSSTPELMDGVFRAAHSLKGTAGFFSLDKIVAVAHELESVFSEIKNGKLEANGEIADTVLQSADCLRDLVENIGTDNTIDTENLIKKLKNYSDIEKNAEKTEEIQTSLDFEEPEIKNILKNAVRHGHKIYTVNINFNKSAGKYYKHPEEMLDNISSIGNIVEAVIDSKTGKIIKNSDSAALASEIVNGLAEGGGSALELLVTSILEFELFSVAVELDDKYIHLLPKETVFHTETAKKKILPELSAGQSRSYSHPPSRESDFSIRLAISAVNNLTDLANEMILARNQLLSVVADYKKSIPGLVPVLHDISRLTSEIQEKAMLTRMQPVNLIFEKFPRIIRDTAKSLNKDIQIEISGGDVMLDKYLLDLLTDPVSQLVRNAADHGLESADRRADLGKPKKGRILLNAYMRDGSAIIEVTDDGAGIDVEALKRKSIECGIVTEEALSSMSKSDILALILKPGISTAKRVTDISGRGVGMDIVKTNIEKLGGTIEIESEPGQGTTLRLKTPLTLSVIRTLIVTINSIQYAVPETSVERIVRILRNTPSKRIERVNNSLVLSLDGQVIPVVEMPETEAGAGGAEILRTAEENERRGAVKCLVLKAHNKVFALLIDDAVQTEETLVKPLPIYLKNCGCYSNATVLGNGNAIMVLDAAGIMRLAGVEAPERVMLSENLKKEEKDTRQIIIFKCSGDEYFALEADEILRIECIRRESIQKIGVENFVNIANETFRVVMPEDFVPVGKCDYTGEKLYILMLKKSVSPIGFIAGKVVDKVENSFKIDCTQIYSDFIFGTSVFREKILIFLDPAAIGDEIEKEKLRKKNLKNDT